MAWSHFSRIKAAAMKQRLATAAGEGGAGGLLDDLTAPLLEFLKVRQSFSDSPAVG